MTNKIPSISPDRLDKSAANTGVGTTKKDQRADAFIKGREPVQPFTIRMPVTLYQELRELAFKNEEKINHIVVKLIRDYVKNERE